jgi:hypothetical protein
MGNTPKTRMRGMEDYPMVEPTDPPKAPERTTGQGPFEPVDQGAETRSATQVWIDDAHDRAVDGVPFLKDHTAGGHLRPWP